MNAHELIAKIARMTDPIDADDNALTLARLIDEARKIAALPAPDNAGLIAELRDYLTPGKPLFASPELRARAATALEAAEARAVEADCIVEEVRRDVTAVVDAVGEHWFLDPPDGGDVKLCDGVKRIDDARKSAERQLAAAREAMRTAYNALDSGADREDVKDDLQAALSAAPAPVSGEHTTLRSANIARQAEWDTGNQITLAYRGNELAGEVGEACNLIKKIERERMGIAGSRATKEQLAEELADVVICTDLIAMQAGIHLDAAVAAKFNVTSEKVGLKTRLATPAPAPRFVRHSDMISGAAPAPSQNGGE